MLWRYCLVPAPKKMLLSTILKGDVLCSFLSLYLYSGAPLEYLHDLQLKENSLFILDLQWMQPLSSQKAQMDKKATLQQELNQLDKLVTSPSV